MKKCIKCGSDNYDKLIKNIMFYEKDSPICSDCYSRCNDCKKFMSNDNFWKDKKSSNGHKSVCKECRNKKRREGREKKKNDAEYNLNLAIKKTIIIENKVLKEDGKRLCSRCHKPFRLMDLWKERTCYECINK